MSRITDQYNDPAWIKSECFRTEDGIYRWKANGEVPPADIIAKLGLSLAQEAAHAAARRADITQRLAEYRTAQTARTTAQIAEERAQARAAHGSGAKLVNVVTGETFTT